MSRAKTRRDEAIIAASRENDLEAINRLLYPERPQDAVDINYIDEQGEFPLGVVAASAAGSDADLKTMEFLIERGARIDLKGANNETALFAAATRGSDRQVEMLIASGSDVRAQNNDGQSAAERAANRHINPTRTDTVAYLKHVVRTTGRRRKGGGGGSCHRTVTESATPRSYILTLSHRRSRVRSRLHANLLLR